MLNLPDRSFQVNISKQISVSICLTNGGFLISINLAAYHRGCSTTTFQRAILPNRLSTLAMKRDNSESCSFGRSVSRQNQLLSSPFVSFTGTLDLTAPSFPLDSLSIFSTSLKSTRMSRPKTSWISLLVLFRTESSNE